MEKFTKTSIFVSQIVHHIGHLLLFLVEVILVVLVLLLMLLSLSFRLGCWWRCHCYFYIFAPYEPLHCIDARWYYAESCMKTMRERGKQRVRNKILKRRDCFFYVLFPFLLAIYRVLYIAWVHFMTPFRFFYLRKCDVNKVSKSMTHLNEFLCYMWSNVLFSGPSMNEC